MCVMALIAMSYRSLSLSLSRDGTEYTVFVGSLVPETTEEDLRKAFQQRFQNITYVKGDYLQRRRRDRQAA